MKGNVFFIMSCEVKIYGRYSIQEYTIKVYLKVSLNLSHLGPSQTGFHVEKASIMVLAPVSKLTSRLGLVICLQG